MCKFRIIYTPKLGAIGNGAASYEEGQKIIDKHHKENTKGNSEGICVLTDIQTFGKLFLISICRFYISDL